MHKLSLVSDDLTFSNSKHSNIKEVTFDDLSLLPDFLQYVMIRGNRNDIKRAVEAIDAFLNLFPSNRRQLIVENNALRLVLQEIDPIAPVEPQPDTSVIISSVADMYRNLQAYFDQRKVAL